MREISPPPPPHPHLHTTCACEQEKALLAKLIEAGQAHLFSSWPAPGTNDADKKRMVSQLSVLDEHYHGGLTAYISNARTLLQDSKEGERKR